MILKKNFDVAIIETISWTPHIGTTYEIAIREKKAGKSVIFIFIQNSAPEQSETQEQINSVIELLKKGLIKHDIPLVIFDGFQFDKSIEIKVDSIINQISNMSQDERLDFCIDNRNIGRGIIASLISLTSDSNSSFEKYPELYKEFLLNSLRIDKSMEVILDNYNFDLVYSFNGRFASCRPIFENLKQKSITFKSHERGATFDKFEIFEGFPHELSLIHKKIRDYKGIFLKKLYYTLWFFINQRRGKSINWVSFINHQSEHYEKSKNEILVTYFSSSDFELEAVTDLCPHNLFDSQLNALNWLVGYFGKNQNIKLVIKMHPNQEKLNEKIKSHWKNFEKNNIEVIMPESTINSYSLMKKSDLIIVYGSTIGMESAFWRKKVINLFNCYYSNPQNPILNEPNSIEELEMLLNNWNLIKKFPFKNFLKIGHWISTFGIKFKYYIPSSLFNGKFN